MKHFKLFILLFIFSNVVTNGQEINLNTYGCGTVTTSEEVSAIYSTINLPPLRKTAGTDTVPITVHIVGDNDGGGYYRLDVLFRVLCTLNDKYKPVGFYFYVNWPIRYINNSSYYQHDISTGIAMMRANNVSNTVNVYFVKDPNGTCGYYTPSGLAIAINTGCAGINSTTLTHEIGHFFGLPHTFFGWEDDNTPLNPEKVTRGSGKNCDFAGDGFCDTDADYLSDRWSCPYKGTKTDVNGERYHPDSSLYMSYAADACMKRFSNQQISWMQGTLASDKYSGLRQGEHVSYAELGTPELLYPTDSIHTNLPYLIWNKVQGAEYYYVRITNTGTPTVILETTTADTVLKLDFSMVENRSYSARISALSSVNVCRNESLNKDYIYTASLTDLTLQSFSNVAPGIRLFPNPANDNLSVYIDFIKDGLYELAITDINGRVVMRQDIQHSKNTLSTISTAHLDNGLYFIRIIGGGTKITQKLLIAH